MLAGSADNILGELFQLQSRKVVGETEVGGKEGEGNFELHFRGEGDFGEFGSFTNPGKHGELLVLSDLGRSQDSGKSWSARCLDFIQKEIDDPPIDVIAAEAGDPVSGHELVDALIQLEDWEIE